MIVLHSLIDIGELESRRIDDFLAHPLAVVQPHLVFCPDPRVLVLHFVERICYLLYQLVYLHLEIVGHVLNNAGPNFLPACSSGQ